MAEHKLASASNGVTAGKEASFLCLAAPFLESIYVLRSCEYYRYEAD